MEMGNGQKVMGLGESEWATYVSEITKEQG